MVSSPQERAEERREAEGSLSRELLLIIGVALLLSVLVRTFVAQAFYVPSSSMEDTLLIQDRILVSKVTTRLAGVDRGEIIVFTDPGGWLPEPVPPTGLSAVVRNGLTWIGLLPSDSGEDLVKRVIGIGGDHVVCCDAKERLLLNGVSLVEPYVKGDGTGQVRFDIVVPQDRVFVMGDNRGDSSDSRFHLDVASGGVPLEHVVGRVVAVIWPASRWSGEPIPVTFEDPRLDTQQPVGTPPVDAGGTPTGPAEAVPDPGSS
jgi:signal peptidase I